MKKKLLCSLGVMASTAALTTSMTAPAAADTTDVTFTLKGGGLSISVQPTATWGEAGASGGTSVSGSLGAVKVTDNRGGTSGWTATASTGKFTNGTTDATSVEYTAGLTTATGVVTPVSVLVPTALSATPVTVVSGTVVVGNNTVAWNPTLSVGLPASSTAGTYAGTITHSVI